MRGEKRPHEVCGGYVIARDGSSRPGMTAALNRVECNRGSFLAIAIGVDVKFARFFVLRDGIASVVLYPERDGFGYRRVPALRPDLEGGGAAGHRH